MAKAALVTGGAKRLGRALALGLAREGFDLAVHYNSSEAEAKSVAAEIAALGRRCELVRCDLSDPSAGTSMIDKVFDLLPTCELLVNNASIFERRSFDETDERFLDRTLAVNFKAPFFLSQQFVRRCSRGHVINLLDTKVSQNFTPYFAYTLSKKLLAEFTRLAACELAPRIRVNGVCPGAILPAAGQSDESFARLSSRVLLARPGDPDAIVAAVAYLVRNDFVTGECLFVDGGEHLQ